MRTLPAPRGIAHRMYPLLASALVAAAAIAPDPGHAGQGGALPLPRFASLKAARVNMRVGPGDEYQVEWLYLKRGLPVEIVQEYDNWRKVRDAEGNEGWILHSLLSGERTAIVAPWNSRRNVVEMRASADAGAAVVARIEPGVVAPVKSCANAWCMLEAGGAKGHVRQNQLWGVYPDEIVKD
jgi:SH3-like domain-containing protein